jgi:hypothetical protein
MKQEIKIYALPTQKATIGTIMKCIKKMYIDDSTKVGTFTINKNWKVAEDGGNRYWQPHHLYAIVNEIIKKGDWFITELGGVEYLDQCAGVSGRIVLSKNTTNHPSINECRKVVATDNKSLDFEEATKDYEVGSTGFINFQQKDVLPQISPDFQQAWVREINNGTPIVDAMMDFEDDFETIEEIMEGEYENVVYKGQPKLNPQGYVTILPVKEKMYSKTEMITYGKLAFEVGRNFQLTGENNLSEIEQNL